MALSDGQIAYWKSDASGSDADATTNGIDGTIYGATYTTSGKINGCYDFDGSNDYIETSDDAELDTDSITIAGWFNTDATGAYDCIMSRHKNGSAGNSWIVALDSTGTNFYWYCKNKTGGSGNTLVTTSYGLTTGTWYHFAAVYNATTGYKYIYINGTQEASVNWGDTTGLFEGTAPITHGLRYNSSNTKLDYFNGKIDETGIWNRVLSSTEISELYNSGSGLQYPYSTPSTGWTGDINGVTDPSEVNSVGVADITSINTVE